MSGEASPEILAELEALRERVSRQEAELAALRRGESNGASRRALFKGAGVVAGGVALASAIGTPHVAALERAPGVDVPRTAQPVALFLQANGVPIEGESTRGATEGAIDCLSFNSAVRLIVKEGSGLATGRRSHDGIAIRKNIDRTTPLIIKALTNNELIEAEFRFFRPSSSGDGTTEHFFTIEIEQGRVAVSELVSPEGYSNSSDQAPPVAPFEDVRFIYNTIMWRYEPEGIEHIDTWNSRV